MAGTRNEGQRLVSRELIGKMLSWLSVYRCDRNYEELLSEVNSERLWDVVKEKVNSGDRHVVDLTVPDGSSFVGNGIVCHNTSSAVTVTEGWFDSGVAPDEVAYLAFTRAAAREAARRILGGNLPEEWGEKLPYFRTIHSLAYRGLKRNRRDLRVVATQDMKSFAQWSGFEGTYTVTSSDDLSEVYQTLESRGRTDWDNCLTAYNLSRMMAQTPNGVEAAKQSIPNLALRSLGFIEEDVYRAFVTKYEQFKMSNGLVDFTDLLKYALTEMQPLDKVKYMVVDELQDNAPILFSICDRLFPNAEAWMCGDPNQSIYRFAGADPQLFLERARKADHRIVLRRTHRFGPEIVEFSKKIIARAADGVMVDLIGAAGRKHRIHLSGQFSPIVGELLILHRHVSGCQALAQAYIMAGLPFRCERGKDPLGSDTRIRSFNTLNELADGMKVPAGAVARLVDELMPSVLPSGEGRAQAVRLVVHGGKKRLQEGGITEDVDLKELVKAKILTEQGSDTIQGRDYRTFKHADDLEYYARVKGNGYSLGGTKIPSITTIHGSKGRQAPGVVVFSEMGMKCFEDHDSEHRLAYVASTRTQGELQICAERTVDWAEGQYDYPMIREATSGGNG